MSYGRHVDDRHRRAARMIGYTLALLDEPAMWSLAAVLLARLTPSERAFVAVASLISMDEAERQSVIEFVVSDETGVGEH